MTTRRILLIGLALLVLLGVGNFVVNSARTRSALGQVAQGGAAAEQGIQSLMGRGVLFDALQGGAPPKTRLAAIEALARLSEGGKNEAAFKQLLQMLKDPDTEAAEQKKHPVRDAAKDAVARVGIAYPEILLDAAKDADGNIKDQSRAALKQIGAPMKEQMAKRLDDGGLRAPLGETLAGIGPDTIPLITPYLTDEGLAKFQEKPDDLLKAKLELIEIMGRFKVAEAARPIIRFKNDAEPNVRRAVVTSLANIGDPVGAPVLIEALNDPNADASARAAAAGALGAIATPEATAAMVKAVADYDIDVAKSAAAGLARAGDAAAPAIAAALKNPDPAVRARAAEATAGLRTAGLATQALSDTDPAVRAAAAASLGEVLSRANEIRTRLGGLAAASTPEQRAEAMRVLQQRGALMEVLRPGAPAGAAAGAITALQGQADAQDKDDKKKPFQDQIAKLNDPAVRAAEAKMAPLADGASPAALAPLLKAIRDTEGAVALAASDALGRVGAPAVPSLVAMLGDANDTVAYYASQALGQVGTPAVDALLPAAQPGKPAARWAAVALGEIRDPRAVGPLEALSQSPDADTAFAAGAALAKVKGQGT